MPFRIQCLLLLVAFTNTAFAADPVKVDRSIGEEPKYNGMPKYCLLTFGSDVKDRVWIVQDGETLYVDKNGNGDLTDPGEKVEREKPRKGYENAKNMRFEVGDLTVNGRTHQGLQLFAAPAETYNDGPLKLLTTFLSKESLVYTIRCSVAVPGIKGGGTDGRLEMSAGPADRKGLLVFQQKTADAPVIHFGGQLEVTFYGPQPRMRIGRSTEFMLTVGSPGFGPGTFVMLGYEDTIPKNVFPKAEITFAPSTPGATPINEHFELKERC